MATAKKLPSGSYRCLVYTHTDGAGKKKYKSFTAKTKKEAELMAAEYLMEQKDDQAPAGMTLKRAIEKYCDMKSNILSPSTLREYRRLGAHAYSDLENKSIEKISGHMLQTWANTYSLSHSQKSTRNAYGLLYAVFKTFRPQLHLAITLPQTPKKELYVPTDSDILALLEYFSSKDPEMEKAVLLAAYGTLRRSEIAALDAGDISGNTIKVCKAVVDAGGSNYVTKTTKTRSSTRTVEMPDFIIKKFPDSGKIVSLNPTQISTRFRHAFNHINIQPFRFHDLRHYAASMMHAIGVPDVYIMERGGWSSDQTLKRVYRGVMEDYKGKFIEKMFDTIESIQHKIQHENKK